MALLTLAPTWTPQNCPAATDIWQIFPSGPHGYYQLGPNFATSSCAPPGYTPTSAYNAFSCPSGYTSACTRVQNPSVTICCPTAISLNCINENPSLALNCVSTFTSATTFGVTTTTLYGSSNPIGSYTITILPYTDYVNAFGIEYIPIATSSPPTLTTSPASAPSTPAAATSTPPTISGSAINASNADGSSGLSSGAAAGVGVGTAVGAVLLAAVIWLLWRQGFRNGLKSAQQPEEPLVAMHELMATDKHELMGEQKHELMAFPHEHKAMASPASSVPHETSAAYGI